MNTPHNLNAFLNTDDEHSPIDYSIQLWGERDNTGNESNHPNTGDDTMKRDLKRLVNRLKEL